MSRICYLLLCHKSPQAVEAQVRLLTAQGDCVVIHVDKGAEAGMHEHLHKAFSSETQVAFAKSVKCGWGEWSLVQASLNALKLGFEQFPDASHFYLISGDCMPVKSAATIHAHLDHDNRDLIEVNDFFDSGWIRVGLKEDRLIYRHLFNERCQKRRFYASLEVQKRLGLKRPLPEGLTIRIGSQWWCLRRRTVAKLLKLVGKRRDLIRFFSTTWIPDETFFQSLVAHLVPSVEIDPEAPTFHLFSDYGMPVNFQNDHLEFLRGQKALFARKMSPHALDLHSALSENYAGPEGDVPQAGQGQAFFKYVTSRGREGGRFTQPIWERDGHLGADKRVLVVVCKKWHVAKRYASSIAEALDVPGYGYLFNEDDAGLPDLGGWEHGLDKREADRAAFLNVLFCASDADTMVFCLDPMAGDTLRMLGEQAADVRLLAITCDFTDGYLLGHAERMGIALDPLSDEMSADLLVTLRQNITSETKALRHLDVRSLEQFEEFAPPSDIVPHLMAFAGLDGDAAFRVAHGGRFDQLGSAHVRL